MKIRLRRCSYCNKLLWPWTPQRKHRLYKTVRVHHNGNCAYLWTWDLHRRQTDKEDDLIK